MPGPAVVLGGVHSHPQFIYETYRENGMFEPPDQFIKERLLHLPWLEEVSHEVIRSTLQGESSDGRLPALRTSFGTP